MHTVTIFNCIIGHLFQDSLKIVYRLASAWVLSTFLASILCKRAGGEFSVSE